MAPPKELDTVKANGSSNGSAKMTSTPGKLKATVKNEQALPNIIPSVLHNIGKTPMIRLNKIPQSLGVECEVCKFKI